MVSHLLAREAKSLKEVERKKTWKSRKYPKGRAKTTDDYFCLILFAKMWILLLQSILIHSANPKSRPVGIIVFAHVVCSSLRPYVRPHFSNLEKQNNRKQWSLLEWLWVWPSGSLMTPVLFHFIFEFYRIFVIELLLPNCTIVRVACINGLLVLLHTWLNIGRILLYCILKPCLETPILVCRIPVGMCLRQEK